MGGAVTDELSHEERAQTEAELAKLSPEEREALELQAQHQMALDTPVSLPVAFGVRSIEGNDGPPAVLLVLQTPAAITRVVLPVAAARELASLLARTAAPESSILTPPGAGRLIVPGRQG